MTVMISTEVRVVMTRLRQLRESRGLSQTELGLRMQMNPTFVSHVEAGRKRPSVRFRRTTSEVLGVPESELFGQEVEQREVRYFKAI